MILFRNDPWIRLVDEFFDSTTKPTQSGYVNVNKKENEDKYELQFLVPGRLFGTEVQARLRRVRI